MPGTTLTQLEGLDSGHHATQPIALLDLPTAEPLLAFPTAESFGTTFVNCRAPHGHGKGLSHYPEPHNV